MNELLNRITQISGQCGGRPCIRGMRIRVSDILEMLSENVSVSEILEDFPDLEPEDIQACLFFVFLLSLTLSSITYPHLLVVFVLN
ncbi:DUF433 domain-containing protein [Dolichospermum sp. LEGE 00240]|jgi:uncharacterized protein (DUF433 family)|uniref:DUF433 domain-containing protein n=1 Tax=Dolichospermum sp. LEGE 00240 TaxID=1828603 RepID=UPI001D149527|nr:DUF433 domain-containing protein [Dolichospermum sp. LEGE 00240]